ncbi:DNA cytosine methyltransferase [Collimonas humicola]|uniref:DNA cytosine methyltransferase n=1 Tax=Collimonas humicola TaxID=2825886 RepID=UPI001B8CF2A2|nr:DNA cytosine methyltransferase [Collimonas humicola]
MKSDNPIIPPLQYGSVCSGIEAATVAWHQLGWQPAWFAEIENFPCNILAYHYPKISNLGDMTKIEAMVRAGDVVPPDVLVGGTPCQAYSVAGLRNGLNDARGQLTISYVNLADAIDTTRSLRGEQPAILVWENVPGVLSDKTNAFGCFLGGLAGEACELEPPRDHKRRRKSWPNAGCVYGPKRTIAWRVIDAQYTGVAQRRRRVFVVASARDDFDPTEVLFEFEGMRRDTPPSREKGQGITGTISSRSSGGGGFGTDFECAEGLQPVAFGGNNTSGCIDVATARNACGSASGRMDFETETFLIQHVSGTLLSNGKAAGSATQQDAECGMLVPAYSAAAPIAFSSKDNGRDTCVDLSPTLRSGNHDKSHANGGQQPAIAFDCRQDPISNDHVFGALGGSSPQAQAVCVTGDLTHTLKAEGFDASEDGTGRGQPIVAAFAENSRSEIRIEGGDGSRTGALSTGGGKPGQGIPMAMIGMAVRRLTPRECERLQGFPDDYTLIPTARGSSVKPHEMEEWIVYLRAEYPHITRMEAKQMAPDGPRYKALGNSMAVTCMLWLGRRIHNALNFAHEREIARAA